MKTEKLNVLGVGAHPDYNVTRELVFAASLLSTVPHIRTRHQPLMRPPIIYYIGTYLGVDFKPEEYVDVSGRMKRKLQALSQHESQLGWLK